MDWVMDWHQLAEFLSYSKDWQYKYLLDRVPGVVSKVKRAHQSEILRPEHEYV